MYALLAIILASDIILFISVVSYMFCIGLLTVYVLELHSLQCALWVSKFLTVMRCCISCP